MRPLLKLLNTGQVAGKRLAFFRSPLTGPDFPWHAADDLYAALRFPADFRRHFQQMLQEQHGSLIRTVATVKGIVTICPHYMAQGVIAAGQEIGCAPAEAELDYGRAAAAAMTSLTDELGLSEFDRVAYAAAAFKRGQR